MDGQKDSMLDLHKQLEKLQQEKVVLQTLITDLDVCIPTYIQDIYIYNICIWLFQKCTVNNCPVELKYKVEKIVKEGLMDDIKNTNVSKSDSVEDSDEMDHNFEQVDNHKENNVCI